MISGSNDRCKEARRIITNMFLGTHHFIIDNPNDVNLALLRAHMGCGARFFTPVDEQEWDVFILFDVDYELGENLLKCVNKVIKTSSIEELFKNLKGDEN